MSVIMNNVFKIGTQGVWFDDYAGCWFTGTHEVDIQQHDSLQEAVEYAEWIRENPEKWRGLWA